MPIKDLQEKSKDSQIEVISLHVPHLNKCVELDEKTLDGLWTKKQWEIELSDPSRLCIGIQCASEIIAFACGWIVLDELQITAIAVNPNHQKLGIGKKLTSLLLNKAKALGVKEATLEVENKNTSARALYKSLGFKVTGRRKNYYKNGSEALILWKNLTTPLQSK